jgi:hypothetical protein
MLRYYNGKQTRAVESELEGVLGGVRVTVSKNVPTQALTLIWNLK